MRINVHSPHNGGRSHFGRCEGVSLPPRAPCIHLYRPFPFVVCTPSNVRVGAGQRLLYAPGVARRRPGICALCGQHASLLEEEDVFPTWARNELQAALAESPTDGQWPARVVLRACPDCNRGLGKEFEEPAAPILKPLARGERLTLDADQMAVIAAWAWLKDIEYILGRDHLWTQQEGETTLTNRSRTHWQAQLSELRASRRPPTGYIVRLATLGPVVEDAHYRRFLPDGWRPDHAQLSTFNGVGLLVIESVLTTPENAAVFIECTRRDSRANVVWPRQHPNLRIGVRTVPLNHNDRWRDEHQFHPGSAWGGGWRVRVPRDVAIESDSSASHPD